MRPTPNTRVERFRITDLSYGQYASDPSFGNNGVFMIASPGTRVELKVIASDGAGWEHVSVSLDVRCPNWGEMCYVKDLFWDEDEVVIQYHPAKSDYVKTHPYCLHLWKPVGVELPRPYTWMIGTVDKPEVQP